MKYTSVLMIFTIIFIIICLISINIINLRSEKLEIHRYNLEYEKYLNQEILGTDIATLINKVVEQNEKNNVQKNEKNYYIDNKQNSIKIDLKMITIDKTYPMEEIYNSKIVNFVQNFNIIKFKCTNIEYHKSTGKIAKLVFEEQK